ncbi:hypothetical protein AV654_32650 [Paenibacillus elgii]|uniref:Uncharacterized protein n=1 Tax=Paenibacillus elgii TaxID=189691 RepID=A0A163UJV0_9BACL|nr:hypothetical protein AV654_32650 [Paenibacillus elgii]
MDKRSTKCPPFKKSHFICYPITKMLLMALKMLFDETIVQWEKTSGFRKQYKQINTPANPIFFINHQLLQGPISLGLLFFRSKFLRVFDIAF